MANIINLLNKELEKGNAFIDAKGNTLTVEKIEEQAKKEYVSTLKAGHISFDYTFKDFYASYMEKFVPVVAVLNTLDGIFHNGAKSFRCEESDMNPPTDEARADETA